MSVTFDFQLSTSKEERRRVNPKHPCRAGRGREGDSSGISGGKGSEASTMDHPLLLLVGMIVISTLLFALVREREIVRVVVVPVFLTALVVSATYHHNIFFDVDPQRIGVCIACGGASRCYRACSKRGPGDVDHVDYILSRPGLALGRVPSGSVHAASHIFAHYVARSTTSSPLPLSAACLC